MFSQDDLTAHGLYELSSHLSLLDRLGGGEFVLDAASGPIAHPEYLAYSWFYRYRVCVDISRTALEEAGRKLGQRGFCCLADVCRLPFREGVFDSAVSAYTIQHIPEAQQACAVTELYRVLKPGGRLCIMSDAVEHWTHYALVMFLRAVRKSLQVLRVLRPSAGAEPPGAKPSSKPPHKLYGFSRDFGWWRKLARDLTGTDRVEVLRLFQKREFELLFGGSIRAAKIVCALENLFRRGAARMGAYLLIDLEKKF
jgi:SAM-dependent methyltransferase